MNTCDCELRNRAWDPNTHKCHTCGRVYIDSRYTDLVEDIHQVISPHGKVICRQSALQHLFTKDGDWQVIDRNLDEASGGNEVNWEPWKVSPKYTLLWHQYLGGKKCLIKRDVLQQVCDKLRQVRKKK